MVRRLHSTLKMFVSLSFLKNPTTTSLACRSQELCFLTTKEIEDLGSAILIRLTETKTKVSRRFTIIQNEQNFLELFRKYFVLRPPHTKHNRFFILYKNGKCSTQPVGRNTFGNIPSKVATYLNLPDPKSYTGHCYKRNCIPLIHQLRLLR
jgi:hypothetical protein